ncbi:hypothetical protein ACOMHN_048735 [Nucella lapillus]
MTSDVTTTDVINSSTVSLQEKRDTDSDVKSPMTWDDATWILTSAFIIFTMQSGFGMLEAGAVASKNTVNIMVKNVVDVVFGGMTYWMFGYALSFGTGPYSNSFFGLGDFFVDTNGENMGLIYSTFVFQLSFATTATTIVSGAMAERTNLTAYIVFSFCNTIIYCLPAHWVWSPASFLKQLGAVDFAGSGVVHLVGASSGLVATLMLRPRTGRYTPGQHWPPLVNPVNTIIGTFMLWWGWLAFNCGSTFGISGGKWKLASKAAVTTLISSMSGGVIGIVVSFVVKRGKYDVSYLVNAILGALVSITASCPLVRPYEAMVIGMLGALCTLSWTAVMDKLRVDDPVSAVAVHGAGGIWGLLAVGLFVEDDNVENLTGDLSGVLKGGGFYLLSIQLLSILCEALWSSSTTFLLLLVIDKILGLRVSLEQELMGADYWEHGIMDRSILHQVNLQLQGSRGPNFTLRDRHHASPLLPAPHSTTAWRHSSFSLGSARDGGQPPLLLSTWVKENQNEVKVRRNAVTVMVEGFGSKERCMLNAAEGSFTREWGTERKERSDWARMDDLEPMQLCAASLKEVYND